MKTHMSITVTVMGMNKVQNRRLNILTENTVMRKKEISEATSKLHKVSEKENAKIHIIIFTTA